METWSWPEHRSTSWASNYYTPHYVKLGDWAQLCRDETPVAGRPGVIACKPDHLPRTSMGWLIDPDGLYDTLVAVAGGNGARLRAVCDRERLCRRGLREPRRAGG